MTDVANVTTGGTTDTGRGEAAVQPPVASPSESSAQPAPESPAATSTEPAAEPSAASPAPPTRSASKPSLSREQLDAMGQAAFRVMAGTGKVLSAAAHSAGQVIGRLWGAVRAVPPALQAFALAALGLALGVFGALSGFASLLCTAAVIPGCAMILGALGHRWYSGLAEKSAEPATPAMPTPTDLQRSVEYVDRKLAVALTSLGTEHHQQALIAMFQAKTAVELTLGTEDSDEPAGVALLPDDRALRPRIRVGSTSLAAS